MKKNMAEKNVLEKSNSVQQRKISSFIMHTSGITHSFAFDPPEEIVDPWTAKYSLKLMRRHEEQKIRLLII